MLNFLKKGFKMDLKVMLTTFAMIFLAELGDKTQLATFALAAENKTRLAVFLGSAGALVLTSLLAVIFGAAISRLVPVNYIKTGAGALFILLGLWMILSLGGK
jgi:putative Ca2+/H+ antiporter (TMEM165/GDT1 family)